MSGQSNSGQVPAGLLAAANLKNAASRLVGLFYLSVHKVDAGVGGAPDSVALQVADVPRKVKLAFATWGTTVNVGAATVTVKDGGGVALSEAYPTDTVRSHSFLGLDVAINTGASVNLARSDSAVAGVLKCYWTPSA